MSFSQLRHANLPSSLHTRFPTSASEYISLYVDEFKRTVPSAPG
jgi:hypothetical protein